MHVTCNHDKKHVIHHLPLSTATLFYRSPIKWAANSREVRDLFYSSSVEQGWVVSWQLVVNPLNMWPILRCTGLQMYGCRKMAKKKDLRNFAYPENNSYRSLRLLLPYK
jgi:hypothetical protein